MEITYHAIAKTPAGLLGQIRVTRDMAAPGVYRSKRIVWTGVTYPDTPAGRRRACAEIARLNGCDGCAK